MTRQLDELFSSYPVHLSVSNLAAVLGVTQKTAYEYLQSGDVPSYRIGTRWLILRDEVKEFIELSSKYVRPAAAGASAGAIAGASDVATSDDVVDEAAAS
jgi:excisionase family DNA binding protein